MASNALTNLRGLDPGANRQTDAISRLVEPVCRTIMATPIMGSKPPAWIRPPLENGFVDFGGDWAPMRYHKDALGYVHAEGFVRSPGGALAGSNLTTFPAGFRPKANLVFFANVAAAFGTLVLYPTGMLRTAYAVGIGQPVGFAFTFLAEQ
jgi:hypothetical protein